jgi:hypothetical protein
MSTIHIAVLAVCMYLTDRSGQSVTACVIAFMAGCFFINLLTGKHVQK